MEEWYSGLIPYPWLLLSQFLIILLYSKVCIDFTRGQGFFVVPRRALGLSLLRFGSVYFAVMVARYMIRMSLYPHERWVGGSIPVFFHWILASFILLVGGYHWVQTRHEAQNRVDLPSSIRWRSRVVWLVGSSAVSVGILIWIGYQLAPWVLARQLDMRSSEFAVRIERGVAMKTSDGITLVSDIYHPQKAGKTPTILVRIPYSKTLVNTLFATVAGRMWAERGYTVVVQGTRGRYQSGGHYYPLRGERRDGIETLAWIAKQSWFNGRLSMWGGSYFGYTQWVLADQIAPGPSALIIQLASTDFHGMFYPGGAFSLESALCWTVVSQGKEDRSNWPSQKELQAGYDGFPLLEADDRVGKDIPFFNDWVRHSEKDEYWLEIDGEDRARRLKAPALLMAGWFDPFLPTQINDFVRIRSEVRPEVASATRLIIGPWAHARTVTFPGNLTPRNYRLESLAPSVAWFDQHLRSSGTTIPETAPVRIYVMGENVWRDEQEWPLARTRYTPYYLRSDGKANSLTGDGVLTLEFPTHHEPPDTYIYDPHHPVPTAGGAMLGPRAGIAQQNAVEVRPDVLVYSTPPLEEDLEVTGPVRLLLYVSTMVSHTDFTGKLVDVHPDGSAYNVSEGILRRGYSPSDQPTEIQMDLWPTSMVFFKRHRIRLEVSSSNYPRFDRNPNTGRRIATETHPIVTTQTVHHGRETPSRLILPVIPR
jgi:putative CocE/NonD family hydrolase